MIEADNTSVDPLTQQSAEMGRTVDSERSSILLQLFGKAVDFSEALNIKYSVFGNPPVYDKADFPWALRLESRWQLIRGELENVLKRKDELPNFQDIARDVQPIQNDDNWKTFFLVAYGLRSERNCALCPETAKALEYVDGLVTAFFSILSPGKHIPPHRGPYNGVLRYHLGLVVPQLQSACRIRIHDRFYNWTQGESLIFDDSFNHEVWNDTPETRVVLFIDFLRPLRPPASIVRNCLIEMATWTPFVKAGRDRHQAWENNFYQGADPAA